jgi:hypothetical protein
VLRGLALDRLAALVRGYAAELTEETRRSEDGRRLLAQCALVAADVNAHRCVRTSPRVHTRIHMCVCMYACLRLCECVFLLATFLWGCVYVYACLYVCVCVCGLHRRLPTLEGHGQGSARDVARPSRGGGPRGQPR